MIESVAIVGSGNVATHIATAIFKAGVKIKYLYSPTFSNCKLLADKVCAKAVENISDIGKDVDLIILSVKDSAIADIVKQLKEYDSILVHTSGGINIDVFNGCSNRCGVLYPLQTFSKNRMIVFNNVPLFIEANNQCVYTEIEEFAKLLSDKVFQANSERRKIMHVAAVFACNFTNHCYHIASNILEKEGIPFSTLMPLIEETNNKINDISPYEAQTGPARRNDSEVMASHLNMIEDVRYKEIYSLLSKSIIDSYKE